MEFGKQTTKGITGQENEVSYSGNLSRHNIRKINAEEALNLEKKCFKRRN